MYNVVYEVINMEKVNCIAVFNSSLDKILMCYRKKNPYKGLYNMVGGKVEENEDGFHAAYRELQEETSITRDQITLHHPMDFIYHFSQCELQIYYGVLEEDIEVYGEENDLLWMSVDEDFFDMKRFAGEGNIGHMMVYLKALIHGETI